MGRDVYLGKNVMKLEARLDELENERREFEPTWVSFNPKLNKETHLKLKCLIQQLRETRYAIGGKGVHSYKGKGKLSEW